MNPNDDDRSARSQVTLRLDRDLLERIDDLAREDGVDRTELVRRLLADGMAHRRLEAAIGDFAAGRRSAWSASEAAGVALYEMLDRIAEAGIPYAIDPQVLDRLGADDGPRPPGSSTAPSSASSSSRAEPRSAADGDERAIAGLRARYRPAATRILFVGESSPAGGTHFYLANSGLYRATREALAAGLSIADPPEGDAFLAWFRELGCWLVDLADHPLDRLSASARGEGVVAGIPALAQTIGEVQPTRIVVVLRRIAPAVRRAAAMAGFDDRAIDVLPFPIRQWRRVYVDQLAGIVGSVLHADPLPGAVRTEIPGPVLGSAVAEELAPYGAPSLHDAIVQVLARHGTAWVKASAIAREIAAEDLWRRPSDGRHPPASQVSARARSGAYTGLFQVSDLGIRLRG